MEAIIFIGLQASGKSTFYKKHFFNTHLRISLDLLNTRNKENQLINLCTNFHQRVVIDNTNPSVEGRKKYITHFKTNKYKIKAYYFQSNIKECLERNSHRQGKKKIPKGGVLATYSKLELPSHKEGFDEIFYVQITDKGFAIKNWENEI